MVDTQEELAVKISAFIVRFSQSSELSASADFQQDLSAFLSTLGDRHSLTSKRPDLWRHLESCFRKGLESSIAQFESDVARRLFLGLDLSAPGGGKRSFKPIVMPSTRVPQIEDFFSDNLLGDILEPEVGCMPCKARRKRAATTLIEIEGSLRAWEVNFEFALRAEAELNQSASRSASYKYLNCMKTLLSELPSLRSYGELKALETRSHTFCELCWRLSKRSEYMKKSLQEKRNSTTNLFDLSSRFCADHDPGRPGSKYRTDLRYKEDFMREFLALKKAGRSSYKVALTVPRGADDAEIRKTAYDLVHSGMKRNRRNDGIALGTCEVVYIELQSGLNQSQIAKKLGISRQAVSKAVKKLESIANRRSRLSEVDPNSADVARRNIH